MRRRPEAQEERVARAFAPGHVTGFFVPAESGRDPRGRGSIGAGIVLEAGVWATARFREAARGAIHLSSDLPGPLPISEGVARRLGDGRSGTLRIELTHELPVGQGFGMSAAGALATALAVGDVLRVPERKAIEVAHLSDLFGGGGLGGVASILGGGLEIRERPGIPPWGRARHRPFPFPVVLSVAGPPIPSPKLLSERAFLARVSRVGGPMVRSIVTRPGVRPFLRDSEEFTDRVHIAPSRLRRLIRVLRTSGAWVAQSMFGESLFSVAPNAAVRTRLFALLERHALPSVELQAGRRGAHRVGGRSRESNARPPWTRKGGSGPATAGSAMPVGPLRGIVVRARAPNPFNRRPARPPPS